MTAQQFAGDALPSSGKVIEVQVSELRRLFNSMDPSPFRNRDLDPSAEEFIVSSSNRAASRRAARLAGASRSACWVAE